MTQIIDNTYNRTQRPDVRKLKVWRYAGLMLTYRCPASCAFCYYGCSPEGGGLMTVDLAIDAWTSLERLAERQARVHLTGGEPFLYFDRLAEIVDAAQHTGLRGPETIETNASWATDREIIRDRLAFLSDRGMERLKISWDPFHAEFIDEACVRRLAETARELLGSSRVLVRWDKYLQDPVRIPAAGSREALWRAAVSDYPCRFTGRAAGELANLFADKPAETFKAAACLNAFLAAKGVHVDPYGNVFSGLCSGIILGNVEQTPLETIWKDFDPARAEVVAVLCSSGPCGLMHAAQSRGYAPPAYFASKCHLCACVRQFFFDNGAYEMIIGPGECYGRRVPEERRIACE
jgi:organic radical activating enzyme